MSELGSNSDTELKHNDTIDDLVQPRSNTVDDDDDDKDEEEGDDKVPDKTNDPDAKKASAGPSEAEGASKQGIKDTVVSI
ncbi:hypothetical protein Daus18300_000287 [Diaporthe australafricana]|uniref:Uncharacterized protein n=1 Tax=Diaporthe australafricana TaxID=127596 RepID=A0ABR3Y5D5_9PEZI